MPDGNFMNVWGCYDGTYKCPTVFRLMPDGVQTNARRCSDKCPTVFRQMPDANNTRWSHHHIYLSQRTHDCASSWWDTSNFHPLCISTTSQVQVVWQRRARSICKDRSQVTLNQHWTTRMYLRASSKELTRAFTRCVCIPDLMWDAHLYRWFMTLLTQALVR